MTLESFDPFPVLAALLFAQLSSTFNKYTHIEWYSLLPIKYVGSLHRALEEQQITH